MEQDMNKLIFAQNFDSYENCAFSPTLYDDRLQTVPDVDRFVNTLQPQCQYQAQEVPDYNNQFSFNEETTPVKFEEFQKISKITPMALNFEDETCRNMLENKYESRKEVTKRKKTKRRSYLSNDLPVEIRNQRRNVANARERARVGRMANGYDALQRSLPKYLTQPKMRKVDILNSALCHIQNLMSMLAGKSTDCNQNTQTQHGVDNNVTFENDTFQNELDLAQFLQCSIQSNQYTNSFR